LKLFLNWISPQNFSGIILAGGTKLGRSTPLEFYNIELMMDMAVYTEAL